LIRIANWFKHWKFLRWGAPSSCVGIKIMGPCFAMERPGSAHAFEPLTMSLIDFYELHLFAQASRCLHRLGLWFRGQSGRERSYVV
jgi:hypothetical protein